MDLRFYFLLIKEYYHWKQICIILRFAGKFLVGERTNISKEIKYIFSLKTIVPYELVFNTICAFYTNKKSNMVFSGMFHAKTVFYMMIRNER